MPLDLTDAELAILAMACRSAAHSAIQRQMELRQRRGKQAALEVLPEQFTALAERLERIGAEHAAQRVPGDRTSLAEWQARHSKK